MTRPPEAPPPEVPTPEPTPAVTPAEASVGASAGASARGFGLAGNLRLALRLPPLLAVLALGLALTLLLRPAEHLLAAPRRPLTPTITRAVCRMALVIMGVRLRRLGRPATGAGVYMANHASWLDIFALNACARMRFVAKAEVARWPGIGWLARATGTLFIARRGTEAAHQGAEIARRLGEGQRLLIFPEGTSTDGLQVLGFKSSLFAPLVAPALRAVIDVQPVSLTYRAPPGCDSRHFGWWGDMDFAPHLLKLLAAPSGGVARVIFHTPIRPAELPDRKALAAAAETAVRAGFVRPLD